MLARGWSITRTADGQVARVADLAIGAELTTTVADGHVTSHVTETESTDPSPSSEPT